MKRSLLLLFIVQSCLAWAQTGRSISGIVRDQQTGEPIPFVNIGMKTQPIGTVSSINGAFQLNVPFQAMNDTLVFSCMGYGPRRLALSKLKENGNDIRLETKSILLSEVLARPLSVEDYLRIAVSRIPKNHGAVPTLAKAYYYELTTENDRFLQFEQAVTSTYFPAYGDTAKSHSSILYGRSLDERAAIQFMQAKMNRKLQRAAKKDKDFEPMLETDNLIDGTSGPSDILGSDPILERPEFLDPKEFKHFKYSLDGIVSYGDRQLLNIGFKQRKQLDHQKSNGRVYIDAESYAFVAVEYEGKFIIPALLKPVIALAGISVGNPRYHVRAHYREHNGNWYVSSAHQDISIKLSTLDLFYKNDHSEFRKEQAFVVESLQTTDVKPIPKEQWVDTGKGFEEQAQIKDPGFWESYTPERPKRLEALVD